MLRLVGKLGQARQCAPFPADLVPPPGDASAVEVCLDGLLEHLRFLCFLLLKIPLNFCA